MLHHTYVILLNRKSSQPDTQKLQQYYECNCCGGMQWVDFTQFISIKFNCVDRHYKFDSFFSRNFLLNCSITSYWTSLLFTLVFLLPMKKLHIGLYLASVSFTMKMPVAAYTKQCRTSTNIVVEITHQIKARKTSDKKSDDVHDVENILT